MNPRVGESPGSLLNALRHVRYAKAFWEVEGQFTVHPNPPLKGGSWVVKLNKINGTVSTRNRDWETGKWISLCVNRMNTPWDTQHMERFIWLDGAMQMLVSSTGACFSAKLGEDDIAVELTRCGRDRVKRYHYIGWI